jgi:hypothetical protein
MYKNIYNRIFMWHEIDRNSYNGRDIVNGEAAAQVSYLVRPWGIFGGYTGTGVGFLQVLPFPLQILIPTVPYLLIFLSSIMYGLDTNSVIV